MFLGSNKCCDWPRTLADRQDDAAVVEELS